MNEVETVLALQIERLEKALIALIARLQYQGTLHTHWAEEIGEILKPDHDQ